MFRIVLNRVYGKPLGGIDPMPPMRDFQRELLKRVKQKLTQETFSKAAKAALAKALRITIGKSSLTITVRHPAWFPLVQGMPKQQMTWLTKAKAPIPIVTEDGKVIFRSATPKSMASGKWYHPGHKPTNFYEKAKEETRAFVKEMVRRQVRKMSA